MARKVRIDWNIKAFEEVRRLPAVQSDIEGRASRIAEACGGEGAGFVANSGQGKSRARASVVTATVPAMRRNARDNTILKNLDAGR